MEQDQSVSAGNASSETGTTPSGIEAQHSPSLGNLSPLRPDAGTRRESTPCRDSTSEGDGADDVEPLRTKEAGSEEGCRSSQDPSVAFVSLAMHGVEF